MAEQTKKYKEALKKVDREKRYTLEEALEVLSEMPRKKI